jgi:hypothetical protein
MSRAISLRFGHPAAMVGVALRAAPHRSSGLQPGQLTSHASAFNATAVWRQCNLEGYLERKLHRQWRTRGS